MFFLSINSTVAKSKSGSEAAAIVTGDPTTDLTLLQLKVETLTTDIGDMRARVENTNEKLDEMMKQFKAFWNSMSVTRLD